MPAKGLKRYEVDVRIVSELTDTILALDEEEAALFAGERIRSEYDCPVEFFIASIAEVFEDDS